MWLPYCGFFGFKVSKEFVDKKMWEAHHVLVGALTGRSETFKGGHMALTSSFENGTLTIRIPKQFDSSIVREYRQAYRDIHPEKVVIDLRDTTYINTDGFGMLLLLLEHVRSDNADMTLIHVCPDVEEFLLTARFDRYKLHVRLG